MAHRKPLGTTCRTTADWDGAPPELHDAVVTDAGTWYRVVGIEETTSMREALMSRLVPGGYRVKLVLERAAEPEHDGKFLIVWPDGFVGVVHPFRWYPRDKKPSSLVRDA